jgi:hypothetical protein
MDGFCDDHFPRISLSAASRLAIISARNPNFVLPRFLIDMGHRLGNGGLSTIALKEFTEPVCSLDQRPFANPIIRNFRPGDGLRLRISPPSHNDHH